MIGAQAASSAKNSLSARPRRSGATRRLKPCPRKAPAVADINGFIWILQISKKKDCKQTHFFEFVYNLSCSSPVVVHIILGTDNLHLYKFFRSAQLFLFCHQFQHKSHLIHHALFSALQSEMAYLSGICK
ncbi:hypothetical protein ABIA69_000235 [Lysinibacillus parviboronicapiens]|uniref:Uncharacterized protein n=1 Tax=Lysinibacillus parviboronicapiens TaxID=436516 RepID=A0ABV2PDR7_9BACI